MMQTGVCTLSYQHSIMLVTLCFSMQGAVTTGILETLNRDLLAPTKQPNANTHSIRSQWHSPERAARNFLSLAIVASTGRTTVSGVNPLIPPVAKNPYKEHAGRLPAHLTLTHLLVLPQHLTAEHSLQKSSWTNGSLQEVLSQCTETATRTASSGR